MEYSEQNSLMNIGVGVSFPLSTEEIYDCETVKVSPNAL